MNNKIFLGLVIIASISAIVQNTYVGVVLTLILSASFVILQLFDKVNEKELKALKNDVETLKNNVAGLQVKNAYSSEKFKDKRMF
ncbi:MAG: hypothetical protein ABIM30_01245 [candidate division WOR-3 bacterium]